MNNKVGRKITSLTLMIIMLAGGMTVASSGMMPVAHAAANSNLFVSAENSQFDNYMSGPQVIEVVVINSDINDADEAEGEPIVTINGNTLRMVQATDGNWYGYFADDTQARIADSTTDFVGSGLDFGTFCTSDTTYLGGRNFVSETVGVAVPAAMLGGTQSDEVELCDSITPVENISETGTDAMNVLREAKEINDFNGGQIGITPDVLGNYAHLWPFIQLYDLSVGGNVNVEYNAASGLQSTSLTFDSAEAFASAELDRSKYPNNAQVHATITDLWLNIDPTDEDSWTFGTNATHENAGSYYQVFDENGTFDSNYHSDHNISGELDSLLCETNCKLFIDLNAQGATNDVLELQDNDNSDLDDAITLLGEESVPVTITEIGPKSGIFGTYDESDKSVLKIASNAARDTSATLEYNKDDHSILVGFDFATIDIESVDDEWNSGEGIPIIIVDGDANSNSRADEDLDLSNPDVLLIPSISTGTPFTLGASGDELTAAFYTGDITTDTTLTTAGGIVSGIVDMSPPTFGSVPVDAFSDRAIIDTAEADQIKSVLIDLEVTMEELLNTINDNADETFTGFNMFNYDVRSFSPESNNVDIFLVDSTENILDDATGDFNDTVASTTQLVENGDGQGYDSLDDIQNDFLFDIAESNHIGLLIQFDTVVDSPPTDRAPIVADFFSYGFYNDGLVSSERIANQIIRIEAEESGDNTSTFVGTLEYIMINQLNINDRLTYESISPIADDPTFIVIEDLTDEDSIRVNYLDLGADGVSTQIADQEEAPSHSGVVSFDSDSYKTADTVVITLDDVDLSVDSDLIDIYTVVTNPNDPNRDAVGSKTTDNGGTSIELSNGDQLGRLLDVTFDDELWTANNTCGLGSGIDAGLGATGFSLVETTQDSGLFVGSFQIPVLWCRDGADKPESATGLDIEVNYVDFRDASGEIIEVGDSAALIGTLVPPPLDFGATVELDQKVYTWTDKVYITIFAPDHNADGNRVDEIGNSSDYPIRVATRGFDIDEYKLVETGTDTGIFTGEVILTGFEHDADGDGDVNDTNPRTSGSGPTDGFLETDDNDSGLTVSFEFSDDETVISSSLIRWNIGEVQWLEASYPASGTGVVRVIDPDMNFDPEAVDNFDVDVTSDSNVSGVDLTVTETNEATGIFEGTVFFTTVDQSSGHRLRVAEGDTVTAEYEDHTLPYPYTTADDLNITATTLIGTVVPPLDFEATVEHDQKIYTWTDKVYITIVAPDHNADGNRVDEIGNSSDYPIRVSTEGFDIDNYKLVETGTNTGIFTGEVILTGFAHVTSITAGSNVIVDQLVPPATPPSTSQEIEQDDLGVTNTGGIKFSIGGLDASTYYQYTTSKCDVANPDDDSCSDFTFAKRSDSNGVLVVIMAGPFTNLQYVFADVKEIGKADPIYHTSFIVQVQGNAITNFESNASSNVIPTEPVIPVPTIPVPPTPVPPTPVPPTPVPPTPVPTTPVPATPTLTQVTIASNNSDRSLAIPGNTVTLSFTSSEPIETPTVTINGGAPATLTESNTSWSATKAITSTDPNGIVMFIINYSGLASNTSAQVTGTTDNSSVTVDKTVQPPITPSASQEIDENNLGVTNTGGIKFSIGGLDASTYYQYTTSKCDVANPDDETCSDFTFAKRSDSNGVLVIIMAGPFTSEQYVFADVKEIGKADPIYSTDFIVQVQNNGIFYFEPNVITS